VSIETDNGRLALMALWQPWLPSLPFGDEPASIDQADQQQLLWGFPEVLWNETVTVTPPITDAVLNFSSVADATLTFTHVRSHTLEM
jgi:hypothetical protein